MSSNTITAIQKLNLLLGSLICMVSIKQTDFKNQNNNYISKIHIFNITICTFTLL